MMFRELIRKPVLENIATETEAIPASNAPSDTNINVAFTKRRMDQLEKLDRFFRPWTNKTFLLTTALGDSSALYSDYSNNEVVKNLQVI